MKMGTCIPAKWQTVWKSLESTMNIVSLLDREDLVMTNEEKILYDFIIDRYGDEKKELVFQIKEMEEIQGIDTKIARLLGNLKEGSYIQEFRLYGKDEIAVKLPEKRWKTRILVQQI